MKVAVHIHGASLATLPKAAEVGGGQAADLDRTPDELRLAGLAPDVAGALPRRAAPPRPSPHAFASLEAAAARLTGSGADPRVDTMLRRAQELLALLGEVERRRGGGWA